MNRNKEELYRIDCTDVGFMYKGARQSSISAININIEPGEFLCILGPSGSGKSTFLRLLAGLEKPLLGQILLNGIEVHKIPPIERRVGFVFQQKNLYPGSTVRFNIEYPLRNAKLETGKIAQKTLEVATLLQIDDLLERKVSQISGGQAQRVAIARALVREPRLFLLDEPFSSLDANLRRDLREELSLLHKKRPATTIYVTHDPIEAFSLADRIGIIIDGELVQIGTPKDIRTNPVSVEVLQIICPYGFNLVEGVVLNSSLFINDFELSPQVDAVDGKYQIVIFPEKVEIVEGEDFVISDVVDMGPFFRITITRGEWSIFCISTLASKKQIKGRCSIHVHNLAWKILKN